VGKRRRLRGLGWLSLAVIAAGGLLVVRAGFRGPAALAGVVLLAGGLALLDAWARGRLSMAVIGVFLLLLGLGVASWTVGVILLLDAVDVAAGPELNRLLALSVAAAASGLVVMAGGVLLVIADARASHHALRNERAVVWKGEQRPWWTGLRSTPWGSRPVPNGFHAARPRGRHPVHRPARG
jgi:drug/metabolite transporter (DMT)-like permease